MGNIFLNTAKDSEGYPGCPRGDMCAWSICQWNHNPLKFKQCILGNKCQGLLCPDINHLLPNESTLLMK